MIKVKQVKLNARETFVDFAAVFRRTFVRRFRRSDVIEELANVEIETHFRHTETGSVIVLSLLCFSFFIKPS